MVHCPACDTEFTSMQDLKAHMLKAISEPDALDYQTHVDIYELEGWDEIPLETT